MSTERNKHIVRQFFEHLQNGELDHVFGLMTPDATWWVPTDQAGGAIYAKEDMRVALSAVYALFAKRPAFEFGRFTAEDDRVCVELKSRGGRTRGGVGYGNDYLVLFVLRDGRIAEMREYSNPILPAPMMAELAKAR